MIDFFRHLLALDFLPHGVCYRWDPAVLWLNVVSDLLIAAAYYAIPFLLFSFAKKRRDIAFKGIFVAFGLFILACGTTHLMGAVTAWYPAYRLDGVVKAITAIASIATFAMLVPMVPALVNLPAPSELARVNRSLAAEIEERRAAEEEVRRANERLEARVAERTAALTQSEARFRQLADAMPQMVWVTDSGGGATYVNQQWIEYIGAGVPAAGEPSPIHADDDERAQALWQDSLRTLKAYDVEYRLRRRDGAYRWFLCRGTPVADGAGSVTQWFGTCTDIDDSKRAAEALERALADLQNEMDRRRGLEEQLLQSQKMEAVGRLAGGVAHDFNNLLTAILGYTEMLREEVDGIPAAAEYAEEVRRAAERAAAFTDQLLAFSRKQVSQPRVVDLNVVVHNLDRMLRRIIGENIVFETRLAPGLYPVKVDPAHIDQILLNLAVNSRDAMPQGGKLMIETASLILDAAYAAHHPDLHTGPHVVISVTDTGAGMDADTRARIFEPFFTTKEKGKGTGLGLSIVYGIVKQSGGEILVYSEPGRGATFRIYLPAVSEAVEPLLVAAAPVAGLASGTILLVEDEDQVRNLARTLLEREGYTLLVSASPSEALRTAREFPGAIRLLLTDVVMPEMGGVDLAREITRERPGTRVLYMSGYTDAGIVHQGVLAPGTPYLQKPFTSAALKAKVLEVLRG